MLVLVFVLDLIEDKQVGVIHRFQAARPIQVHLQQEQVWQEDRRLHSRHG